MTFLLILLACTGPHNKEGATEAAAQGVAEPARDGAEADARDAPPDDDEHLARPGIEEKRGDVSTSPSASLPKTAIPSSGAPGCVPLCLAEREAAGLSASRAQLDCMRGCGGDGFLVRTGRDVTRAAGARVAVEGQLSRAEEQGRTGTVLVLKDGTKVWVTYGGAPHGWNELEGQEVRVIGTLWDGPPPPAPGKEPVVGVVAPHLVDWEAPIPLRTELPDTGDAPAEEASDTPVAP